MRLAAASGERFYASKAELEAWFDRAPHNSTRAFAKGPSKDPRHEVQLLVEDWQSAGEASLHLRRCDRTGDLLHLVRRKRESVLGGGEKPRRVLIDEEWRDTPQGKIFLAIVRAANMGQPCPSNLELSRIAGLRNDDAARYQLYQLRDAGRLRIENSGIGNATRRVQIIETGRWTA